MIIFPYSLFYYWAVSAAGAIIHYIEETQKGVLGQLTRLSTYATDNFMALDVRGASVPAL